MESFVSKRRGTKGIALSGSALRKITMLIGMLWLCALHLQILVNKHAPSGLPSPAVTYLGDW